jgi:hypothetical protein
MFNRGNKYVQFRNISCGVGLDILSSYTKQEKTPVPQDNKLTFYFRFLQFFNRMQNFEGR